MKREDTRIRDQILRKWLRMTRWTGSGKKGLGRRWTSKWEISGKRWRKCRCGEDTHDDDARSEEWASKFWEGDGNFRQATRRVRVDMLGCSSGSQSLSQDARLEYVAQVPVVCFTEISQTLQFAFSDGFCTPPWYSNCTWSAGCLCLREEHCRSIFSLSWWRLTHYEVVREVVGIWFQQLWRWCELVEVERATVWWDRYSPTTGSIWGGCWDIHRFQSPFLVPSAVFVFSLLSACVLFLRVDAHSRCLGSRSSCEKTSYDHWVTSVIDCCETVCVLVLMSTWHQKPICTHSDQGKLHSSATCLETMSKRTRKDSGEERVTAKSKPMMNLVSSKKDSDEIDGGNVIAVRRKSQTLMMMKQGGVGNWRRSPTCKGHGGWGMSKQILRRRWWKFQTSNVDWAASENGETF